MNTTCQIPRLFTVNDTVSWTESWADYPATLFTLTLTLVSTSGKKSITATADGDDHAFTLDASGLSAGRYDYQLVATGDGYRQVIDRSYVTVQPDLGDADTFDGRSHVKKVLDALEAVLENRASKSQLVNKFDGVDIQYMDHEQISKLRDKYKEKYFAEQVQQGKKQLLQPIRPRFRS